jgi:redox-sensitive bicupin YhaK (pirin superfamily)
VYRGALDFPSGCRVPAQRMAILANTPGSDGLVLQAAADTPTRAILIAGRPLREPIAQHGPFVMNSHEELVQAVRDYQAGVLA